MNLGLDDEIGTLDPGRWADLVVLDPTATPVLEARHARDALDRTRPDALLSNSTQWVEVLDQLWQTRRRCRGIHVDENWYKYGDLPHDLAIDAEPAGRLVERTR